MFEDVAYASHGVADHLLNLVVAYAIRAMSPPCGMVGDNADGGIIDANFPCQGSLRHAGHANHGGTVTLEAVDFRSGFETRSLHGSISSAIAKCFFCVVGGVHAQDSQNLRIGFREIDMRYGFVDTIMVGVLASMGIVDDLVWNDDGTRRQFGRDTPDRCYGNHFPHTLRMQGPQIGAIVHKMRRNGMAVSMTRQEHNLVTIDVTECQCTGRFSIGGPNHLAVSDFEIGELGEAGTADDAEHEGVP